MNILRAKQVALHYVWGLVASTFNGGIMGLGALGIMEEQKKLPEGITKHVIVHTFAVACAIHALLYFQKNPLPERFPADTNPPFPPKSLVTIP